MGAGKVAEREGDGPTDEGCEHEAQDNGGPGEFDSSGGAEKQSGADGAADGNHSHLSGGELMAEAGLWVTGLCVTGSWVRACSGHMRSYTVYQEWEASGGERIK